MTRHRVLALLILTAFAGCAPEPAVKDLPSTGRAKYAKYPADALSIVEPVQISGAFYWKDGGTAGIELTDANGKKHAFSLYPEGGAGLQEEGKKPTIIPNLFVGATHPSRWNAKMVRLRGPEESALYGVLLRAMEKHKEKDAIVAKGIDKNPRQDGNQVDTDSWEFRKFFDRLESHFLKE